MSFGTVMSGIGNVLGGLATGVSSIIGAVDQVKTNDLNFKLQQDELAYQKDLQKIMFAREDNAVQRRVADLKAAGLSPTLAAGSSANAGSVVSTTAPQKLSNLNGYLALAQVGTMLANQQKAQTDADIARQQLKQTKLDTKYLEDKGLAPLEVNQDWKQRLVNLLYPKLEDYFFGDRDKEKPGIVQKVITAFGDKDFHFGKPKPGGSVTSIPYAQPKYNGSYFPLARITTDHGTLNDREYWTLKNAGLLDTWIKYGMTKDVYNALKRNGR